MTKEYIERSKVIEVIKDYGKNAIEDGQKTLDPVDDILLLVGAVNMIPAAVLVEIQPEIKINYDRIRNMSVEEMSNFLMDWAMKMFEGTMPMNVKTWLESEVDTE